MLRDGFFYCLPNPKRCELCNFSLMLCNTCVFKATQLCRYLLNLKVRTHEKRK